MRTDLRSALGAMMMFGLALTSSACPQDAKLPIGGSCNSGGECVSGICAGQVCLDPEGDADGDTLVNSLEQSLGSDPVDPDTDGDGIPDGSELDGVSNKDTDGDGLADIIESATNDTDGDCITDQYDAENQVQNGDLSPMRDVVCSDLGVCAGQDRALFGVLCPVDVAVCDYSKVVGYVDPEVRCDGVDDNCDGAADDGFPDRDADGVADCVDTDWDNDDVDDDVDNCPFVANGGQDDAQDDGVGDACAADLDLAFTLAPVATLTAGAPFDVTVTLQDESGTPVGRFHGDVTLSLTDAVQPRAAAGDTSSGATLTGTTTATAEDGVATFTGLVISPPGAGLALTATSGDLAGVTSDAFDVLSGELAELRPTGAPTTVTAGDALSLTLTAYDAYDNVLTTFDGSVSFSSNDPAATLPDDFTFGPDDAGTHAFDGIVLRTAGAQTITVSDAGGALATIDVTVASAAAASFGVDGLPETLTAGAATSLTVSALDAFGNVAGDYTGAVSFAVDDDAASVPADHAFVAADAGSFTTTELVLRTTGAHTVTVGDGTLTGSADVSVVHAEASALDVQASPAPFTAGTPFSVTVTVVDAFGNVVTDFAGTVALDSSDPLATLPSAYTFSAADQGVHVFTGVTLVSSGDHTVSATSSTGASVTGAASVTVASGSDVIFVLEGLPEPATAGVGFGVTVTAKDTFGNVVTDYVGTVSLLASDDAASLPAPVMAVAGVASFSNVVLKTAGAQTLTAADTAQGISQSEGVTVVAGAAVSLAINGPSGVTAGTPFTVTVTAEDAYGNAATGYTGTVHLATSDDQATLPADYAFTAGDAGQHVFGGVVFRTVGAQTVTLSDVVTASITGQASVTVGQGAQIVYELTGLPANTTAGTSLTATLSVRDTFGNPITDYSGIVAFTAVDATSGDPVTGATLPPSYTFVSGDQGSHTFTGVVLRAAGTTTVRAAEVGAANISASAVVNVAPGAMSRLAIDNAPSSVTAGTAFGLRVTAYDANDNIATAYTGPVAFSASREGATLPSAGTLTAGRRTFSGLVLTLAGPTSVSVTGGGAMASVNLPVVHGAPASLELSALPSSITAGAAQSLTATIRDTWGNVATNFTGTASVVTDDPDLQPSSLTFTSGDQGARTFAVTFHTVGGRRITVDAGGPLSATRTTSVVAGDAVGFDVTALPGTLTAGSQRTLTVTLRDAYANPASGGHANAFTVSSSDGAAVLAPSSVTIAAGGDGTGTVSVTLVTAGAQSVTFSHPQLGTHEVTTTIKPAAASKVVVSDLPPTVTAGASAAVVVRISDAHGNTVSDYSGVVNVSSSDDAVTLSPGSSLTFPSGQPASVTLTATFETAGDQRLDFLDTGLGSGGAAATTTTVKPAAPRDLVATPATGDVVAGTAFDFTVALYDAYGNLATSYAGTVSFGSNDDQATLPAATTYTAGFGGTHTFSATLRTAGAPTITCTGTALAGAASDDVQRTVSPSSTLDHFTVVPSSQSVTAGASLSATVTPYDAWDNLIGGFTGAVAMSVDDPDGSIPATVAMSGATVVSPIKLFTAGTTHITAALGAVADAGTVAVVPATPTHIGFGTQPGDGYVSAPLPTFAVAFYDAYDNVATNMAPQPVTLTMGRNAGPGHLVATVATSTSSGVATFSAAQIDAPGQGYDLIAATGLGSIRSARFDVTWRPAALVGTPTVSGSGGCRTINYVLAQANGHPADVLVEYRIGGGVWHRATQRPGSAVDGDGTRGVATSAIGVAHTFGWDAFADVGLQDTAVSASVTPVIDGVAGTAKTVSFSAGYAWDLGGDKLVISSPIKPGPIAVGDYDRNGLDDVLLMARDAATVDVFFQTSAGHFSESAQQLDIGEMRLVGLAPWQPAPGYTRGFFALSEVESTLYILTRSVQGIGDVGWSVVSAPACPSPTTNKPVAMALGDVYGARERDAVIACAGADGQAPTISIVSYDGQMWGRGFDVDLTKAPTAVAVTDLGHDGWQDIIVGDSGGLRTVIGQYGEGFCQAATCGNQVIEARQPTALAVADFDNDGQLDVITVDGGDVATFFRGDVVIGPQGVPLQYLAPQGVDIPLSVPASAVVARDVNDDGVVDVVVGSFEADAVEILLGGDLSSWEVRELGGATGAGVNSLWVGDLDRDGRTDVVAGRSDPESPWIGLFQGKPFQQCRPSLLTSGAARFMVGSPLQEVADVDGDGRNDAIWMTTYSASIQGLMIGYGDGAGGFQRGYGSYATSQAPSDMALGDLDNDGLMDAVLNDGYTDNVDVALQDPAEPGTFSPGYASVPFNDATGESLLVIDADNDGLNDLFYLGSGALQRYYGDGDTLQAATPVALGGGGPTGLGHADVNKDGYQDFAYYGYVNDADSVCFLMSTGPRSFATSEDCTAITYRDGRVQLVDLDGDGVEEMVYVSNWDYSSESLIAVRWQQHPDAGDFGEPMEIPTCFGGTHLRFADADADGRTDIVVSCGSDGGGVSANAVMIVYQAEGGGFGGTFGGFGTGGYQGPSVTSGDLSEGSVWGLASGDATGDLFDDVYLGATTTARSEDGAGFVTPVSAAASDGSAAYRLEVADLDGNGLLDAVTAGGQSFSVALQSEPGKFATPTTYTLPGVSFVYALALGDVDGDGRPDVVLGAYIGTGDAMMPQVLVYRQTLATAGIFDVDYGLTSLSPTGSGDPNVIAVEDFEGVGVPAVMVSWATYSSQGKFDVFLQNTYGSFTKIRSDPYTSAFPTQVVSAGFGWFGRTDYREPFVAGRCGTTPCVVTAAIGGCALQPPICFKSKTTINLGAGVTAPLYTSISGAVVADLDKDGYDDVVANLGGSDGLHVYAVVRQSPTTPGTFLAMQTFAGAQTTAPGELRLVDLDHDGLLDIVSQYSAGSSSAYEVLLGTGTGTTFGAGFAVATSLSESEGAFVVRDLDRDGWPDLLTLSTSDAELLLAPQR